jgi:UvrD/REP helicase N-terminal domain
MAAGGMAVRIVVSEVALEALLAYNNQGPEHSQRIRSTLGALEEDGCDRQVLRLNCSPRPVWTHPLDENLVIYFTHGHGADALELRIVHLGPPHSDPKADLRDIVYTAGDLPYHEIPDNIRMEERQTATARPDLPDRTLSRNASLRDYLNPSDEVLLEALVSTKETADDLHGRRYRILTGLRSAQELPIRLSPQQERLLASPLPLLFQGVAGSGKTTVVARMAHRQLLGAPVAPSVLIVAYTEELREFTEIILKSLGDLEPTQSSSIEVRTWRELCDHLATSANLIPFAWAPHGFFLEQLQLRIRTSAVTAKAKHLEYEIQEFIRSTLKGQAIDPASPPPPPRQVLLRMGSTPLDGRIDRGTLYDLAQHYQRALAMRGLSDDTDAARQLLAHIDSLPKYDYVMVDEVQDYTLVQLLFLSRLCRRPEGLLFAGDLDQTLHSSDFTWERVRQALWKAWSSPPPTPVTIDYNYRNPQPVANLANMLLEMRARELRVPNPGPALSNQALTPRPIRLVLPQTQLEALLVELASKIGSLGIIRKDEPDDIFINGIKMERSFTPRLAKGLEFNVVCLVNFNEDFKELAAKTKGRSDSQRRLQFNEVYVSVTRTRAQLLLLDRRALRNGLWESPDVSPLIDAAESAAALSRLVTARFENRTKQDWELNAAEFESLGAYGAAGECWERSGRPERAALNYERAGRLEKALHIYRSIQDLEAGARIALRLGRRRDAADFLERVGQLGKAADLWAAMGRRLEAARLYQRAAEAGIPGGDWSLAGRHYAAAKANEAAAMCYERAGDWAGAAESWLAAGEPARAAALFERAGDWAGAAESWLAAGELLRAAAGQERLGRADEAAAIRAVFHEAQGELHQAAEQWLAAGEPARAAALFERAGDWAGTAESRLAAGNEGKAAAQFVHVGDWFVQFAQLLKIIFRLQQVDSSRRSQQVSNSRRPTTARNHQASAPAGRRTKAGWTAMKGRHIPRERK